MRHLFFLCLLVGLFSCNKKEEVTPVAPVTPDNDTFNPSTATLIKSGALVGIGHSVSGTAALFDSVGKAVALLDQTRTERNFPTSQTSTQIWIFSKYSIIQRPKYLHRF